MKTVQGDARVVLVVVTHMRGVTTRMGVWTVIGIVFAHLHVVQDVRVAHVNAGQETAHRVTTDMWVSTVI